MFPKELTIVIRRPEGYEDVCAELVVEDLKLHEDFVIVDYKDGNHLEEKI